MKKLPIIALLLMLVLMTAVDVYITGEGALHANTRTPGSTVENPMPVTLPLVDFAGDTSLYGDDYEATWVTPTGNYLGGDDMVLQFILTEQSEISGTLQAVTGNWIGMYVVNTAPNPTTPAPVLASATNTGTLATMSPTTLPAGTYYLLISTWPSPQSFQFNLNLSAVSMINPPAPANIVSPSNNATNVAANASLNWTAGSGAPTGYYLYFGTNNPPTNIVNGSDLGNVLTYNPGLLTYSTPYYWQVVPYNPYGNASECPVWSFTTMDDPTEPLPYLQDFEIPTTLAQINWTGTFSIMTNHGTSGSKGLSRNLWSSATSAVATTPPIGPLAPDSELKFDYRYVNYSSYPSTPFTPGAGDQFLVQVSTDGVSFSTVHTIDQSNHVTSTDFAPVTINLAAYSGTIYVKFDAAWATGDYYLDIDNVMVREVPLAPIILVSPDAWDFGTKLINTTSPKEFTITNIGVGSLNVSSINVSGTGFTLTEAFTPVSLLTNESASFTVNFAPTTATTYSGNIAINDNRAVTNIPLSGEALDATIYAGDLPHLENFDTAPIPDFPLGWEKYISSTSTPTVDVRTSGTPNSTPNHVYMYNSGENSGGHLILISPPIDVSLNTLRTKFYAKGGTNYALEVGTWDGSSFTMYQSLTVPSGYALYSVDFSAYAGTDNRIAFRHGLGSTYRTIYIDDVIIEVPAPIAPEPATVAFPLDGMTTFVDPLLKWTPSASGEPALSYKVYLNQTGTFSEGDLVYEGTDLQYQTTGLSNDRSYYWKVLPTNNYGSDPTCPTWSFSTPGPDQLAESFDATAFPPAGWANGTSGNWTRSTATPLFHGTGHAYKFTSTTVQYQLSTPLLTINNGDTLDFWTRATTTAQILQVAYSEDRVTWTQLGANITYAATGVWYQQSFNLSELAGNNYYLAFQTGLPTATGSIYVDHVIGPDITPVRPGAPTLTAPLDAAVNQSSYPSLSWSAPTTGGIPTGYNVYLDTVDGSTLFASNVSSPYVLTTPLEWDQTYYWTVKAFNAAGTGDAPAARSFTVMSDPTIYDLPYAVDFGTTTSDPFPPSNWTRFGGLLANPTVPSGTGSWVQDDWLNITTTPNKAARINIYGTLNGWLLTPPIQVPATGYELKFDLGLTDYANSNPISSDPNGTTGVDDVFAVLIGDGSSWTPANVMRQWDNQGSPNVYNDIPHTGMSVILPIPDAGTYYIAFYGASTVSNADNDLFVDNVMIRQTPTGPPHPVTLTSPADEAVGLPIGGFNLTWADALTGGTPTEYAVFMGSTVDVADYAWYNITGTSFDPTQAGFDPITYNYGETWFWMVDAINGSGNSSDDYTLEPFSFTIMDDPRILSLPYSQNFDGVSAPALPAAFVKLGTGTVQTQTTNNYSAPNCLYMYSSGTTTISMLVLPDVVLNNVHAKLSFMGRANFTAGGIVQVGYLTDPTDPATFVVIDQVTMASLTYESYEVDLGTINGTMHYALRANPVSPFNSLLIDNLELTEVVPIDMSVVSLTGMPYGFQNTALTHTVTVKNNGSVDVSNYTVYLKSVETRAILGQESFTDPLAANATNAVEFTWTPTLLGSTQIYGEVVVAGDAVAENNVSESMTFDVLQEGILFESFEGGVIPANWTVLNADGGTQVWQATTVNPRTGTYAARVRYETSTLDNDDWLITPPLQVTSGTTDNISFWMRSYSATDADPWQVLISTTDTNPASFTMIDEGDGMLANYVQKSYNLDSYGDAVIYLAVRYMGAYDWYLYVDDFIGPPIFTPTTLATPDVTISTVGSNVVLNWDAIPYATSYEVMAADAPEGPWTLASTVTAPTYSSAATSKKFFKVIAKAGATRSITTQALSLEQQLLQDELDKAARSRQ